MSQGLLNAASINTKQINEKEKEKRNNTIARMRSIRQVAVME
jgi:hypothetical protein